MLLRQATASNDGLYLPKKLSNVSISHQIGVHQVTVAKIMSYLQKEAIIQRTPQGIQILDSQKLQAYADGEKMNYL